MNEEEGEMRFWLVAVSGIAAMLMGCTAKPPYGQTELTWDKDIKPIFETTCIECHGGSAVEAALNFNYPDVIRKNQWGIYKVVNVKQTMPPLNDKGIRLSEIDRLKINNWMRGNAPGIGTGKPY